MHKDDCIWTEPNRCNCGWLQDIAKNPGEAVREIARLRAELAEAKRDAERYRWWRRFFVPDAPLLPDAVAEAYTGEELDAAIDAAMAGGE